MEIAALCGTKDNMSATIEKIYVGCDIHAYTKQICMVAEKYKEDFSGKVNSDTFECILGEMFAAYGPKVAYINFRQNYRDGSIIDPEVPVINVAVLLYKLWNQVKDSEKNSQGPITESSSFKVHFNQTLDDIGMTCIQGISHRLLIDFVAFCTK